LGVSFCFITEISFGENIYKQKEKPGKSDPHFVAYRIIMAFVEVAVLNATFVEEIL
jgi:hypothetical protein